MTDCQFRLLFGMALSVLLYLDSVTGMDVLIACLVFEGVTSWCVPLLTTRFCTGRDDDAHGGQALNIAARVWSLFQAGRAPVLNSRHLLAFR